jgi:hypothetical protein
MSHLLPPQGHKAREMFAVEDLVAIATRQVDPVDLQQARRSARLTFESSSAVRRVCIVLRADDQLELVSFGRRLAWRREWRFGGGLCPRRIAA